jgi:peptide/nickel transport system substrate-binding protein
LWARAAVASIALVAIAGCGGGEESSGSGGLPAAGGGGTLSYAVPSLPATLDPLAASSPTDALIARQVHEPLTGSLRGPYGEPGSQPGLSIAARPSPDRTVWTFELRRGVRFQDGTPFNASAVLANSRRWRSMGAGRGLLGELFAVDAPRPNEVRFLFDSPVADLPRRLASPRFGLVSPQALEPRSGEGARLVPTAGTGTGPFRPGARGEGELHLARYAGWWGSGLGLGPALDTVAFIRVPADAAHLALLRSGEVQVADPLRDASLRVVGGDPLLRVVEAAGRGLAMEASVRGLGGPSLSLSSAWLTTVGG